MPVEGLQVTEISQRYGIGPPLVFARGLRLPESSMNTLDTTNLLSKLENCLFAIIHTPCICDEDGITAFLLNFSSSPSCDLVKKFKADQPHEWPLKQMTRR